VSEHTTAKERIIWDAVCESRLREGRFIEGPTAAPTCLEAFVRRLLAERDALAKQLAESQGRVRETKASVSWLGVGDFQRDGEGWIVRWDRMPRS
jgi:hypothetical protein